MIFGSVRATSATDLPTLAFTGVARKEWSLPAFGPVSTLPCPRFPALVDRVRHGCVEVGTCRKQRVKVGHYIVLPDEGMGPVVFGVLIASHHLALLLMSSPKGVASPGRRPRLVTVLGFCQRVPKTVPSALTPCPTIWPWSLMATATAPGVPRSANWVAVPFFHNTAFGAVLQVPDQPTAWPRLLMPLPRLDRYPP